MGKKLGVGIAAAVVVVVGAALGTSYYMGERIEQSFTAAANQWSQGALTVEVVRYERGAFSSHAQTQWTYVRRNAEPLHFTAEHAISHGPLPMGHAAQVLTKFALPDDTSEEFKTALAGRAPLELLSKIGWNRSTAHALTSPSFTVKAKNSQVDWGGMQAQWDMPANFKGAQGTATFPAMAFKEDEGSSVSLSGIAMRFHVTQPEGQQFWTGPFAMQVADASVQPEDRSKLPSMLQGMSLDSDTVFKSDMLEMWLKWNIANAQLEDSKASNLTLDMAVKNLDANWVNTSIAQGRQAKEQALTSAENNVDGNDGEENGDEAPTLFSSATRDAMLQNLAMALSRQPELEIKKLSMRTAEGVSEMGGALRYTGDGKNLQNLVQDLQASLQATLPEPMLRTLLIGRARQGIEQLLEEEERDDVETSQITAAATEQAETRLAALKELGALQASGDRVGMQLQLAKGEVQLNGKALDLDKSAVLFQALNN